MYVMEKTKLNQLLKTLSEQVRAGRDSIKMIQAELAEDSETSIGTIQKIEYGAADPQISTIVSVSDAIGVPVNQLVGRPMKSDLIVSIVSILPTLNEDQLRSVLRSTTGLSSGPSALRANKSTLPK